MSQTLPILYIRRGCPYCARVLMEAAVLGVSFDERDIADPAVAEELVRKGGKAQAPYLVDEARGVAMYESDAIVEYLHATFTPDA
jgi:glutathione S-transferase